jgi:hypothetical protein
MLVPLSGKFSVGGCAMKLVNVMLVCAVVLLSGGDVYAQYGSELVPAPEIPPSISETMQYSSFPVDTVPPVEDVIAYLGRDMQRNQQVSFSAWSPDGKWTAVAGMGSDCIFLVPADGGDAVPVFDDIEDMYDSGAGYWLHMYIQKICGFSPDGTEILFVQQTIYDPEKITITPMEYNGTPYNSIRYGIGSTRFMLRIVTIETGEVRDIGYSINGGMYSPSGRYGAMVWDDYEGDRSTRRAEIQDSHDGSSLTIPNMSSIYCFTPDERSIIGSVARQMVSVSIDDGTQTLFDLGHNIIETGVDISLDGKWLLCSVGCGERTIPNEDPSIVRTVSDIPKLHALNLETDELVPLHPLDDAISTAYGRFSPDGTMFSYLQHDRDDRGGVSRSKVYVQEFPFPMSTSVAGTDETPAEFSIAGNFPNPFNPATTISFSLAEPGHAGLAVYNIAGQLVRELTDGVLPAGTHDIVWDGCDDTSMRVSSGVYIARLTSGAYTTAHRMTLVK